MLRAALVILLLLPVSALAANPLEGDAGSGRDAPPAPDASFLVDTDVLYSAWAPARDVDVYGFEAASGDRIEVVLGGSPACAHLVRPDGRTAVAPSGCTAPARAQATVARTLDEGGIWYLRVTGEPGGAYRFGVGRNAAAPPLPGAIPGAGADPTCGTGVPVTATGGSGPGGLAYAALKTGTRAVVAWTTDDPLAATLSFNLSGGATATLTEPAPRRHHVFVLDGLPRGASVCFTTSEGDRGAFALRNAMYAHDGEAYVINLLVLANEQPNQRQLEYGLDNYAWRLRDATDGHVKAGQMLVIYGDPERHNSGWVTCYLAGTALPNGVESPSCREVVDVLFTVDAAPGGAASTYLDGIRNPRQAIWMNSYFQAGTVNTGDDVGAVLMHEMGHYAFGALDLYVGSGCDVHEKSLSVMSGDRALTEFDDEVNRCPNEAQVRGYVPSWTLMRQRFPLVPDRMGVIDAGPVTPGDAYERHAYAPLPVLLEEATTAVPEDDAGSGRDAPQRPDPSFAIARGVTHHGRAGVGDPYDVYAFQAVAGETFSVALTGAPYCAMAVTDVNGQELRRSCTVGLDGQTRITQTVPADGTWFLRVTARGPYAFTVG